MNIRKKNLPQNPKYKGNYSNIGKKTLIFDLDETLIHCNDSKEVKSDIVLPIIFENGETVDVNYKIQAGINIRPYAIEILEKMSKDFEIIIFTASHSCYANVILDHLDPKKQYIQHRLFRESCVHTQDGFYVKDLRIINREMKNMILVDNAGYSFSFQVDNGIPILNYYHGREDRELLDLMGYLDQLNQSSDVREFNRK